MTMLLLKSILFKFMELGLGLKTYFSLETRDPIFVNFKLTPKEVEKVRQHLPAGLELQKVRFAEEDTEAEYWVSYNLYQIKYPKKELQSIRRSRCEINTFVRDSKGRKGILVFSGSPFVSKERRPSLIERICQLAERMVIFIYGCGKLLPLTYELSDRALKIEFDDPKNALSLRHSFGDVGTPAHHRLSEEYWAFNDISFFNGGKTHDFVNVSSSFYSARFHRIEGHVLEQYRLRSPFLDRRPDRVYFHRGDIAYLVDALNRS
jgi:hypothetical protein